MYPKSFIELVTKSVHSQENLGEIATQKANPFFIGFGNPNSNILFFGKEKAFDEKDKALLFRESINNGKEWLENIKSAPLTKEDVTIKEGFISSFYPYSSINKSGHTWSKYQKLVNLILEKQNTINNEFFFDCFISEINANPSKLSKIKHFKDEDRLNFLKSDFYNSFKIVILACGDYLNATQIEDLFQVKYTQNLSKRGEKLVIYKNNSSIIVNTRQLSMDVSNDYLSSIATIIKDF